jgi:hypothetical protein
MTETVPISVRPIMRAEAVVAVCRGLRWALRRLSRPGTPPSRANGRPSSPVSGPLSIGPSSVTPRKKVSEPPPAQVREDRPVVAKPAVIAAAPASRRTVPIRVRTLIERCGRAVCKRERAACQNRRKGSRAGTVTSAAPPPGGMPTASSRSAATGGIRPARRAGR